MRIRSHRFRTTEPEQKIRARRRSPEDLRISRRKEKRERNEAAKKEKRRGASAGGEAVNENFYFKQSFQEERHQVINGARYHSGRTHTRRR